MLKKIIFSLILFSGLMSFSAQKAQASEGLFELRNKIGTDARCFAASVLMQDQQYKIVVSCRDILYPGGTEVFAYVVWATPTDGKNAFRLGTLGLGKVEFKTKTAFSNLFVTKEPDDRPKSPTGQLIMEGSRQIISLLDGSGATNSSNTNNKPNELMTEPTATPTASPEAAQSGTNVFRIIAAGGIIAFLALFGIVLVVFVITRR